MKSTFRFWSRWRQWSVIALISHKYQSDIHSGLGVRVSGAGGFYTTFKALKFISSRFKVPVSGSADGKAQRPSKYPCDNRWVIVATMLRGESSQEQRSGGLWFLSFLTYVGTIPGPNHTRIVVIDPGGLITTSEGACSWGIFVKGSRASRTQRIPISQRPVYPGGSLSGWCPRSGPSGKQDPYLVIGTAPPPGLLGRPRLTVVGITQWVVSADRQKWPHRSLNFSRISVLTQQSTPLVVPAIPV